MGALHAPSATRLRPHGCGHTVGSSEWSGRTSRLLALAAEAKVAARIRIMVMWPSWLVATTKEGRGKPVPAINDAKC